MKIRAYTLYVHVGHAPCWMYDDAKKCELLSLANCKWPIREVANAGEWIAGVTPTRMEPRLAFLMKVDEIVPRRKYWSRYETSRFDSIYKPNGSGTWIQLKNPWHTDEESFKRDLKSDKVLLSAEFYVFANSYSKRDKSPKGLRLAEEYSGLARGGMRGYGHFIDLPEDFLAWIEKQPRMALRDFKVIRDFGDRGCGCCDTEEDVREATCGDCS